MAERKGYEQLIRGIYVNFMCLEVSQHPSCRWLVAVSKIGKHEVRFFPGDTLLASDSSTAAYGQ